MMMVLMRCPLAIASVSFVHTVSSAWSRTDWQITDDGGAGSYTATAALKSGYTWSDGSTASAEIASQLTAFGIKTTIDGIDSTMRQSNINDGAYEVAISFFGTSQPHPMFAFETPFLVSNVNCAKGLSYPMVQQTESCGTVNLEELIAASTAGWDTGAQKEAVRWSIINSGVSFRRSKF